MHGQWKVCTISGKYVDQWKVYTVRRKKAWSVEIMHGQLLIVEVSEMGKNITCQKRCSHTVSVMGLFYLAFGHSIKNTSFTFWSLYKK